MLVSDECSHLTRQLSDCLLLTPSASSDAEFSSHHHFCCATWDPSPTYSSRAHKINKLEQPNNHSLEIKT